jgi:hypothetical protein
VPPVFSGRIEAKMVVPTGGAAVSASNSGGGATTVTTPAASYYMTAAGGVSSLIDTFESQLNTSRAPSSGAWTVALGSDGRVSIGCTGTTAIPSFSLDWTSTVLRDVLGFTKNINYPTDATELTRQLGGYGTWTGGSGWLCNESSGDMAPVFGAITLADSSSPTYSDQGPRGGADKAVGFDSANDRFAAALAATFNPGATDDLAIVMVAKFSSVAGNNDILGKGYPGAAYFLARETTNLQWRVSDGVDTVTATATVAANVWYAIVMVLDRAAVAARVGVYNLSDGSTSISSATSTSAVGSLSNGAVFGIGDQSFYNTGNLQIAALYAVSGSGVAAGMSANMSTVLASFGGQFGTITGTEQAEGVWYPDAPLTCDDHPSMAPRMSDLRTSQSPTGVVLGLSGNTFFKHTGVAYQRVPVERIREASATYANASLEVFWEHTQLGLGPSWFSVSSPVQVYWSDAGVDTLLGEDETITGWTITGAGAVKDIARPSQRNWVGQFDVTLPALIASGA